LYRPSCILKITDIAVSKGSCVSSWRLKMRRADKVAEERDLTPIPPSSRTVVLEYEFS